MHPTPKCCTLMCGLGFRLFEGDSRMIAFPLGSVSPLAMRLQACQIIILYDPYLKFSLLRPAIPMECSRNLIRVTKEYLGSRANVVDSLVTNHIVNSQTLFGNFA
jgi:hypothetical protein